MADNRVDTRHTVSRQDAAAGDIGRRRPYQKPRVERHFVSSLVLGNVSGTQDGLSGQFRTTRS
jgi:hypothetical protein